MEKNLLEYFKSLGEDNQKIKLMESFSHGTLMTNYVQKGLVVSTVGFNSLEKIQCCTLFLNSVKKGINNKACRKQNLH